MSNNHVPAWKRLGLKLKYANENLSAVGNFVQISEKGQKRKQIPSSDDLENPTTSAKKARTDDDSVKPKTPATPLRAVSGFKTSVSEAAAKPQLEQSKRKKSVSFSVGTKDDDGDSARNVPITVPGSPGSTPKKPKREKRSKADRPTSTDQVPKKSIDALDYLGQHFHDRTNWKFNKNREIWILKHVLSTDVIPSELNAQLAGYIHGLKSTGAKSRLVIECREALSEVDSKADDGDFRPRFINDLKNDNLRQSQQDDTNYSSWIKDETRPALILLSLGQSTTNISRQANGTNYSATQTNGTPPQRVKKSKARTSRIEIDSDSDSDSSSSDSDETSDPSDDESANETSSSGTSGSDSTSASSSSDSSEDEEDTSSSGSSSQSEEESEPKINGVARALESDGSDSDSG